jgi:peptidylprolyl isomerase
MMAADPENTLILTLDGGDVVIALRPDLAPGHVDQIKSLAREGFYDGVVFHRVIDGFMAQGGDPTGTGMGGSEKPNLKAEFSREPHVRGVCSMARSSNPNSANSQFFICFDGAWSNRAWSMSTRSPRASRRARRARSSRRASPPTPEKAGHREKGKAGADAPAFFFDLGNPPPCKGGARGG